ncbi:MAG: XdhC family protein, partial [Syntrophales bacterium]|nr:XdhC family protein [Syntrophales bacterium]
IDDRAAFANRERFPTAAEIHVVSPFTAFFDAVAIPDGAYIVIMTRGHLHDRDCLARALRTRASYIGMIASRRKRDIIFGALTEASFREEELRRVHSPVGLPIGARTPAEIAVSITAELIQHRAGH